MTEFDPSHRRCLRLPLMDPDHPHAMLGRRADSIAATTPTGKPADAVLPVLRRNSGYRLSREKLAVLGPDTCTPRGFDRTYTGEGVNPR
jgi:hypothetical protein